MVKKIIIIAVPFERLNLQLLRALFKNCHGDFFEKNATSPQKNVTGRKKSLPQSSFFEEQIFSRGQNHEHHNSSFFALKFFIDTITKRKKVTIQEPSKRKCQFTLDS